ncbi:MAG: L,D-transpeptidase family protein, partial [Acidimicrobiales bacterium]
AGEPVDRASGIEAAPGPWVAGADFFGQSVFTPAALAPPGAPGAAPVRVLPAPLEPLPDPASAPALRTGSSDDMVALAQRRLEQLGFRPGNTEGRYTPQTASAVMAFQKHEGIARNGSINAETWERLAAPQGQSPTLAYRMPRVEVDIDRQVAFVMFSPSEVYTLNVSSGGGYRYSTKGGGTDVANTPRGEFYVQRRINGIRVSDLGELYRPLYFTGGYAIHGSNSVPGYPASHGCVRVSNADIDWLFDRLPNGAPVVVKDSVTPDELLKIDAPLHLGDLGLLGHAPAT